VRLLIRALLVDSPNSSPLEKFMQRFLRDNGLSLVLLSIFLGTLIGQSITGLQVYNNDQRDHRQAPVAFGTYLTTGHFIESVFENWESEFLQDAAYVMLTVYLYQRGSSESKDPDKEEAVDADPRASQTDPNAPWPVRQGGAWLKIYEHSLFLAFLVLFVLAFVFHALGGTRAYNREQVLHGGEIVSTLQYLGTSQFWFESFQNWQSEFLALLAIVTLSIVLRQRGSPESKPVASPHAQTGEG
jgi:hypothetical protein